MQFTVMRSVFQRALSLVNHAVARGTPQMPLLACVRLEVETDKQRVKLQATNLEISLSVFAPVEDVDAPGGVIAVPARLLMELFATLSDGKITFTVDLDIWKIRLTHATGQASFMGQDPEHFPPIPAVEHAHEVQVYPADLVRTIREVGIAVARDDSRGVVLTCVLLQGSMERLTLAAADGRRVSYGVAVLPAGSDATPLGNLLLPSRALAELTSILTSDMVVMMSLNSNRSQILFSTPTFVFSAILMNGEFPNYRAVVPEERPLQATLKTEELLRAVRAARIFTDGEKLSARFSIRPSTGFEPGSLTIATQNEMGSNSITIPALVRGPAMEVPFNIALFLEALQVISTSDTGLEIGQAAAAKVPAPAGILMPVGGSESVHAFMSMKA